MQTTSIDRRSFLTRSALATGALSFIGLNVNANEHTAARNTAHYICTTCGSQFAPTPSAPAACPICQDERQYIGANGQQWTTLETMRRGEWRNRFREQEPHLFGIGTEPKFGIGQRALLVQTDEGNVLWDCISFLDEATILAVKKLGGISAIAISHPHYYTSMVEWSRAFGNAPIHLHEADRSWVQRADENIRFWSGSTKHLPGGLTLIHTGGHFDGFQVLHWPQGANGRGALLSGDQPQVCADPNWVSFMYSYPNYIPLNAPAIRGITTALNGFDYERLYGFTWSSIVERDASCVVQRSAERYLKQIAA